MDTILEEAIYKYRNKLYKEYKPEVMKAVSIELLESYEHQFGKHYSDKEFAKRAVFIHYELMDEIWNANKRKFNCWVNNIIKKDILEFFDKTKYHMRMMKSIGNTNDFVCATSPIPMKLIAEAVEHYEDGKDPEYMNDDVLLRWEYKNEIEKIEETY